MSPFYIIDYNRLPIDKVKLQLWISDYQPEYLQCSQDDQKLVALLQVDNEPYKNPKHGYRKRNGPSKLLVKLPLVEESLDEVVKLFL